MITEDDLLAARTAWGDALVAISKAYEDDGIEAARDVAGQILDAAYGYNLGPVLFKPTLSGGEQTFRTTRDGALSYFVGHSDSYPQDGGFGIKGWREVRSQTAASFIEGDVGMWMGWIFCIDKDGNTTKVDKTFGYKKDADGTLRIVLHHSSLPFEG
ncbi:phosphoribosyl-AMP cyclohydrolase [Aliiroseovarius marinus]|uniref:phosphoribosyl-AMP cyclohydrolase n=1 Tax=Aliiroseovarius marinus TaxID=2500159 RepID=UPI003D7EDEB8